MRKLVFILIVMTLSMGSIFAENITEPIKKLIGSRVEVVYSEAAIVEKGIFKRTVERDGYINIMIILSDNGDETYIMYGFVRSIKVIKDK